LKIKIFLLIVFLLALSGCGIIKSALPSFGASAGKQPEYSMCAVYPIGHDEFVVIGESQDEMDRRILRQLAQQVDYLRGGVKVDMACSGQAAQWLYDGMGSRIAAKISPRRCHISSPKGGDYAVACGGESKFKGTINSNVTLDHRKEKLNEENH
jgi:hypothetical protein